MVFGVDVDVVNGEEWGNWLQNNLVVVVDMVQGVEVGGRMGKVN